MNRTDAERLTAGFMKPVYGFALRRCATRQDAEDLSQDICLKLYRALLERDDIEDVDRFVWTLAHNALVNHYRGRRAFVGAPPDVSDEASARCDAAETLVERETAARLRHEIACLSRVQRRIVTAFYYENRRQEDIARELGLPVGTVKWHLFEAKKELRKGMDIVRQNGELSFNPIHFELCGMNGSIGEKGPNSEFFRSALAQNIAYSVRREALPVNEIAAELGVAPAYAEDEAEYLTEYGFLLKKGGKYIVNMLIEEDTEETVKLRDALYRQAARDFANELFDALTGGDALADAGLACGVADKNYLLWTLIPYIAAYGGEHLMRETVMFDEAATIRPDGAKNICYAVVERPGVDAPYMDSMKRFCGPMWNGVDGWMLWQINSEWSDRQAEGGYADQAARSLKLLLRALRDDALNDEECALLCEQGYMKREKGRLVSRVLWLKDRAASDRFIALGSAIKERHWPAWSALRQRYTRAVMKGTPAHLRKMRAFGLQYIFFADGWFILYVLKALVEEGRLSPPKGELRRGMSTLIAPLPWRVE